MPRHHMTNGVQVPFTPGEESARDAEEATWEAGANDRGFAALRQQRNSLLTETDWWISRGSITEEQTNYRQALRDLPANTADPASPVWPTKPGD